MTIDEQQVNEFVHHALGDLGAALSSVLTYTGDQLGLYEAMADGIPVTPATLAQRTGTDERYVREWLNNQAAGGWLCYQAPDATYSMPLEHAAVLLDHQFLGAFQLVASAWADQVRLAEAYRSGNGIGWHEHDVRLFHGTERFFRPGYAANLVDAWIPALHGVESKLTSGARVADVGCGHGVTTILMGQAYPDSLIVGFDYHDESIVSARKAAADAGVGERVSFEVASAKTFPGTYDFVCIFDALHDMGDPVGAAEHIRQSLAPNGTLMVVEPRAGDRVEDNLNPLGRVYYAASAQICTPASRAQEVGLALGAQAGPARITDLLAEAGFTSVRIAAETPLNLVFEARP